MTSMVAIAQSVELASFLAVMVSHDQAYFLQEKSSYNFLLSFL